MKYPNLRYGNPREFQYWAMGIPRAELARQLRRSERSVRDCLSGRERVPWWVPEIMRLQAIERDNRLREMGMGALAPRLGLVAGEVLQFSGREAGRSESQAPGSPVPTALPTRLPSKVSKCA